MKHLIRYLSIDLSKRRMLTCGADDVLKVIWQENIYSKLEQQLWRNVLQSVFVLTLRRFLVNMNFFQNLTFRVFSELL